MSDEHARSPQDQQDDPGEIEEVTEPGPEEIEEPDTGETEGAEAADEPGEPTDDDAGSDATRRETRGQPDRGQRDRRLTRQEEFDRAVDRAVERRMRNFGPQQRPTVDVEAQRRAVQERRNREIEEAKLAGNEAEVRDRHLREDYRADEQARESRFQDARDEDRFDRLCSRNQVYDSIRDDVEREVDRIRGTGFAGPLNRELIAKVKLGERYAERISRQGGKQRRDAERETSRQTVRPPRSTAGHQPADRRRRGNAGDLSADEFEQRFGNLSVSGTSST